MGDETIISQFRMKSIRLRRSKYAGLKEDIETDSNQCLPQTTKYSSRNAKHAETVTHLDGQEIGADQDKLGCSLAETD